MRGSNHRTRHIVAGLVVASVMAGCRGGETPAARRDDGPPGGTAHAPIRVQTVGDASRPGARTLTSVDHRVVAATSRFGLELFASVARTNQTENALLSPLAVYDGIVAVHHAAAGATRGGLGTVLGIATAGERTTETAVADLWRGLPGAIPDLTLRQALWFPHDVRPDSVFADWATADSVHVRSIAASGGRGGVDRWFRDGVGITGGRSAAGERGLLLTSTAALTWRWPDALDARGETGTFRGPNGTERVAVATIRGRFRVLETDAFRAVRLPSAGATPGLYVLIPSDRRGLPGLVAELTFDTWTRWMSMFEERVVDVTLPRFAVRDRLSLDAALGEMGFRSSPSDSDLAGIASNPAGVSVLAVEHAATLDVPSPTASGGTTPPRGDDTLVVDRPFLVVVRDDVTAAVLFIGAVVEVQ